jgi:hypothetical protein
MPLRLLPSTLLVCALIGAALPAHAQTPRPERPYRGLFASGAGDFVKSLTAEGTAGAGWDSEIVTDVTPVDETAGSQFSPLRGAGYSLFSAGLAYSSLTDRRQFGASAATSARYYGELSEPWIASHTARLTFGTPIGRSARVAFGETYIYQPFGSLNVFSALATPDISSPGVIPVAATPNLDLRALNAAYWSNANEFGFTKQLSRRSSLAAGYEFRYSSFTGESDGFAAQNIGGRFEHTLTQHLSLRLGYTYADGRFRLPDPEATGDVQRRKYRSHAIDSGVNYNRLLSLSRRTTVGFSTGALAVSTGLGSTRWDVFGTADLDHELGRTWNARATFRRGVGFIETLNQPLFTDAISVGLQGLASRRIQVNASAGASAGEFQMSVAGDRLWSYFGTTGVTVAISRYLGVTTAYNYYHYKFTGDIFRDLGFAPEINRHSISVYASAWAPLIQKGRRNASR